MESKNTREKPKIGPGVGIHLSKIRLRLQLDSSVSLTCYSERMESSQSARDAWLAYEAGEYDLAVSIWQALIELAPDAPTLRSHVEGYLMMLTERQQWAQARGLLHGLQERSGEAIYFHLLGRIERLAGNPQAALQQFDAAAALLDAHDSASLAANRHQRGLTALAMGDILQALAAATESLRLARASGEASAEAQAHQLQGEIALAQGDARRARECYADAAVAYAMAGDTEAEAEMASRIAAI